MITVIDDHFARGCGHALAIDPKLAAAFRRLTPGWKKSNAIHVGLAKKAATRVAHTEKLRPKILSGKRATER